MVGLTIEGPEVAGSEMAARQCGWKHDRQGHENKHTMY